MNRNVVLQRPLCRRPCAALHSSGRAIWSRFPQLPVEMSLMSLHQSPTACRPQTSVLGEHRGAGVFTDQPLRKDMVHVTKW